MTRHGEDHHGKIVTPPSEISGKKLADLSVQDEFFPTSALVITDAPTSAPSIVADELAPGTITDATGIFAGGSTTPATADTTTSQDGTSATPSTELPSSGTDVPGDDALSVHMICGGVDSSTNDEKLGCYQTTVGAGIKFSTDSANRARASSFCQNQLASEMSVSPTNVKLSESIILSKSMAAQCSQYYTLGKTVPAVIRASILNVSAVEFSSSVAAGFGMMLTAEFNSTVTADHLADTFLTWIMSSSAVSSRTNILVDAATAASLKMAMSSVSQEVVAEENYMMYPQVPGSHG
jgi:hypothetical protein